MTRRVFLASGAALLPQLPVQWLAIDLARNTQTGEWLALDKPVAMGSLLKPFLMMSYAATQAQWPVVFCSGARAGCWSAKGHGRQDVIDALANSCNAYFLELAAAIDRAALDRVCLAYGLAAPDRAAGPAALIGLERGWPQTPQSAARAFSAMSRDTSAAGVNTVLRAMSRCASTGTAHEIGMRCYAKTGTAPCSHSKTGQGDGFVVAIYPEREPSRLILVQHHNTTGAMTARDVKRIAFTLA